MHTFSAIISSFMCCNKPGPPSLCVCNTQFIYIYLYFKQFASLVVVVLVVGCVFLFLFFFCFNCNKCKIICKFHSKTFFFIICVCVCVFFCVFRCLNASILWFRFPVSILFFCQVSANATFIAAFNSSMW